MALFYIRVAWRESSSHAPCRIASRRVRQLIRANRISMLEISIKRVAEWQPTLSFNLYLNRMLGHPRDLGGSPMGAVGIKFAPARKGLFIYCRRVSTLELKSIMVTLIEREREKRMRSALDSARSKKTEKRYADTSRCKFPVSPEAI